MNELYEDKIDSMIVSNEAHALLCPGAKMDQINISNRKWSNVFLGQMP